MSFFRFSDNSDLYLYDDGERLRCLSCQLMPILEVDCVRCRSRIAPNCQECTPCTYHKDAVFDNAHEAYKHVRKHIKAGHKVPKRFGLTRIRNHAKYWLKTRSNNE